MSSLDLDQWPADIENPSITVCTSDPNEEQCEKQRCGMIYNKELFEGRRRELEEVSSNNLFSGLKDCYEQITGVQQGCYKQDLSYKSSRQSKAGIAIAWGECALKCKESSARPFGKCTFWT